MSMALCGASVELVQANEHVLLTGQADGTLKLFAQPLDPANLRARNPLAAALAEDWTNPQGPIMSLEEHTAEAGTGLRMGGSFRLDNAICRGLRCRLEPQREASRPCLDSWRLKSLARSSDLYSLKFKP